MAQVRARNVVLIVSSLVAAVAVIVTLVVHNRAPNSLVKPRPAEDTYAAWRAAVGRSRELVAEVIQERGLDGPAAFTWPDGRTPTVRTMLLDMIEEYARHTGHADLLREAVDGLVGEGAPDGFTF